MATGLKRFDEIQHIPLRVYNRVVMSHNLLEDGGEGASRKYMSMFNEHEQKQMLVMMMYLKQNGKDETYKVVTKGLDPSYDVSVEDE